jgi:ABC-type proline/glycine betaine transport system permease subunit
MAEINDPIVQNSSYEELSPFDQQELKKYETLYEHSKDAVQESITQFDKLYQKAGYHLTIVGILFIALGILTSTIAKMIMPVEGTFEIIISILPVLTTMAVFIPAISLLNCLRVIEINKPKSDDELFDWVEEHSYLDTIGFLTEHNMKATSDNDHILLPKAKSIKHAFICIIMAIVLLVITFTFTTISIVKDQYKLTNDKPEIMKDFVEDKMSLQKVKPKRNQSGPPPKKVVKEDNPRVKQEKGRSLKEVNEK